jgi:hypothetical protein
MFCVYIVAWKSELMMVRYSISSTGYFCHGVCGDNIAFPQPAAHIRAWSNGRLGGVEFLRNLFLNDPKLHELREPIGFPCGSHVTFTLYGPGKKMPIEADSMAMEVSGLKVQCLHFFVAETSEVECYLKNNNDVWARVVGFMQGCI